MKKIVSIEGMQCMHCAGSVEKALLALSGVTAAKVSLEDKNCTVEGDLPADDAMINAVTAQGFSVTAITNA